MALRKSVEMAWSMGAVLLLCLLILCSTYIAVAQTHASFTLLPLHGSHFHPWQWLAAEETLLRVIDLERFWEHVMHGVSLILEESMHG